MIAVGLRRFLYVLVIMFICPSANADGSATLGGAIAIGVILLLIALTAVGGLFYFLYSLVRLKSDYRSTQVTLIILEDRTLITNLFYKSSQDIDADFSTYISSHGPLGKDEMIDLLCNEYSSLNPSASKQIDTLLKKKNNTSILLIED